ncbi:hypothetical protein NC797_16945 [Aquibacillus sp. 3ASR75-11]|uniref:Uncharacterized protein n=1 Tax=Terrihalobacillus insolitus TaxID=2950438 RepID=A0A9X3WXV8_9BACI|nr:hypothetical protein [Terrihalobacillus insolitus]MDC3413528.1 hypothetical protein [Terrihalobacillus insolitus]MDC3426186.1 hypothetical protein [Terrihalobacillus insolitus]
MEKVLNIIKAEDFNFTLTNLLIDLYSVDYESYFEELHFDESEIENLTKVELDRLTKVATVIEYVGNRQPKAKLYKWIYSEKLRLDDPYTPGVEDESIARIKRIFSAPKEFSLRNVFFDEETLKPI